MKYLLFFGCVWMAVGLVIPMMNYLTGNELGMVLTPKLIFMMGMLLTAIYYWHKWRKYHAH